MAAIVIGQTWNGGSTNTRATIVTFALEKGGDIRVLIDAPFHNDPPPPVARGKFDELYKYEVVEIFLAIGEFPGNDDYSTTQYLELGVGPHGHWYAKMFSGEAQFDTCDMDLNFPEPVVQIIQDEDCWNGEIRIPVSYVPEPESEISAKQNVSSMKWMMNACAIHGVDSGTREYMSLSPNHSDTKPNFHQLKHFVPLVLRSGVSDDLLFKNLNLDSFDSINAEQNQLILQRMNTPLAENVNLNDADDDDVSTDEEETDAMRSYRMLSNIIEERPSEVQSMANSTVFKAPSGKTENNESDTPMRQPSKDWYTIGKQIDENAPQTLAAFVEQYRGSVILEKVFGRYMNDDEFALLCANIWKRKGWSHKERVLILTSRPRLLYFDTNGKYKGTIPWTTSEQIKAIKISRSHFDIATGVSQRLYHIFDKPGGADRWVDLINKMVEVWSTSIAYEKNKQADRNSTTEANSGGRSRSGTASGLCGKVNTATPPTSGSSITNVPLTLSEVVDKYRPGAPTALMSPSMDPKLKLKNESLFARCVHADEFVILQAHVSKQQGFLSKNRVLILTSKPRLLYLKSDGTFVGTIAWSMTTPIVVKKTSATSFDITESVSKSTYNFTDANGGADRWVNVLKEICDTWAAYLKWQVGNVKHVGPQSHQRY